MILALAWRLLRGSRRRLVLLLVCLALAVAGRVAVQLVVARIEHRLAGEARLLLGADVEAAAARPWTDGQRTAFAGALPAGTATTVGARLTTMAAAGTVLRPVDLRAVDAAWPLVPVPGGATAPPARGTALVQADLLPSFGLAVGDLLRLGRHDVRIAGVLGEEAGLTTGVFSLGPRVLVSLETLEDTGLAGTGARVGWTWWARLGDPAQMDGAARALRRAAGVAEDDRGAPAGMGPPADGIAVRTAADAQAQASRTVGRFADVVRLTALAALLLGTVGIAALLRGHLIERLEDVALLRVLGAGPRRVAAVVVVQAAGLGLVGGALGALLGIGVAALLAAAVPALAPGGGWSAAAIGVVAAGPLLGAVVAVAAVLVPLSALLTQAPLPQLRGEIPTAAGRWRWPLLLGLGGALTVLAAFDARSWTLGPVVVGLALVAALILHRAAALLLPAVARARPAAIGPAWAALRHGMANLDRPGHRPEAALVALGLGVLLLGSLSVWRASLLAALDPAGRHLPGLFVIDVQEDQREAFAARCAAAGAPATLAPIVTARLRAGAATDAPLGTRDAEARRFFRDREQRLSWRDAPDPDNEVITAGRWMAVPGDADHAEASLEEGFADRLGVGLGDVVTFDVLGTPVTATVTSLRRVEWTRFKPAFFILLSPAALAGAPATWIASIPAQPPEARRLLQADLVATFPNLTVLDVADLGRRVLDLLDRLAGILRLVALLALAAGLATLVGLALASAAARRQEGALLRVLGARRQHLVLALGAEYLVLGLLAGVLGAALAAATGALVAGVLLRLPVAVPLGDLALLALGTGVLAAVVGVVACRGAWRVPPLEALREVS